jgi:pimeloyl-ACP methyl ester carboxylesterase
MKRLAWVVSVVLWTAVVAGASRAADAEDFFVPVTLRNGSVHGYVRLSILYNPTVPPNVQSGSTILAVHGVASTGNTFNPLARALFQQSGGTIRRVVLLDLLGHGGSTLPQPSSVLKFGDMTLADDVETLTSVIRYLQVGRAIRIDALIGHSMGGMLVQLTQQQLLGQGTSLHTRFGIDQAVVMGTTVPQALPWRFADSGDAERLAAQFITTSPILGTHLSVSPDAWVGLWFTNLTGELAPLAPKPEQARALGYVAPEALVAALELIGGTQTPRPRVDRGAFACVRGTRLSTIAYEQDVVVQPSELKALQVHLTGATQGFAVVPGRFSVHDMLISEPAAAARAVLKALAPSSVCPISVE